MSGRQPTHSVKVYDESRDNDKGKYIGVGWAGRDGSIAIKLDAGICLTSVGARIVVFPKRERGDNRYGDGTGPQTKHERDERPGSSYE